jgi:hypothetical protein
MAAVAFHVTVPAGCGAGSTIVCTAPGGGGELELQVPVDARAGDQFAVLASQLPFSWASYGHAEPPSASLPSSPPVRRCTECGAVISRTTQRARCAICVVEALAVHGWHGQLPAPGEGHWARRGAAAAAPPPKVPAERSPSDESGSSNGTCTAGAASAQPADDDEVAGWTVCPRCHETISKAGYSWLHHMR